MRGIEGDDSEMAYRRGYEHGVIEMFHAVERFLAPATREVLRAWIQEDVHGWRYNGNSKEPTTQNGVRWETMVKRATCHDCGTKEGQLHILGCDMERCAALFKRGSSDR